MTEDDSTDRPVVVLSMNTQSVDRLFTLGAMKQLTTLFTVVDLATDPDPDAALDQSIGTAFAVVGQPDLTRERLLCARKLKAIVNVEGNFLPNVDYPTCFERGIRVLNCAPAYGRAVAEFGLGLALDLARGITREDRAFRAGTERYLGERTADSILLQGADVGFIGFGNLGRSLRRLLRSFNPVLRVYDPWLPNSAIEEVGAIACPLAEVIEHSQFLFILAAATNANGGFLGRTELALVPPGARVILLSRAAVVDYEALLDAVEEGRFLAAIDVWPTEPVAADDRARRLDGLVLSPHRAGGIPAAFSAIGDMVVDDLSSLLHGVPPVRMQAAAPELVGRYRNRPAQP
jgi:phosphoglycerate dehydrogenase-like enzyme